MLPGCYAYKSFAYRILHWGHWRDGNTLVSIQENVGKEHHGTGPVYGQRVWWI